MHSKNGVDSRSFFAPSVIGEIVPTTWANTMKAQIALLREALKDQNNSKFVFLSETAIPITSFEHAYMHLMRHPYSEFWHSPYSRNDRKFGNLKDIYKNCTWIVLNRKHAQLMVDDTTYIDIFASARFDEEHFPSSILAFNGLLHEIVNEYLTLEFWCPDCISSPYFFENLNDGHYFTLLVKAINDKSYLFARKFSKSCNLSRLHDYLPELY